jgi:hypothetical protein
MAAKAIQHTGSGTERVFTSRSHIFSDLPAISPLTKTSDRKRLPDFRMLKGLSGVTLTNPSA